MPSWPSPTRTPASRSASSGSGSRLPGATVVDRDVLRREQLDQGRLTARVHRAEREGVTDRHQTLHPERSRAFGDQLERERAELSDLVEVDVDADSVPFGDAEHDVEMGDRITVVGARIETADEVGACPHGGVEQVGGTRVAKDAGLRECDHLHVGPPGVRLPGRQHSLQPLEPTVGVDLDVAADRRGARGDRGTQRRRRPLADRGPSAAPVRTIVADQPGEARPGGVRAERQAEAGRVEMGVGIGERRQQHTAPAVGDRHTRGRLASGDPAIVGSRRRPGYRRARAATAERPAAADLPPVQSFRPESSGARRPVSGLGGTLSSRRRRSSIDLAAGYSRVMALSAEKYIRVTTFKKDGTEVSTPTWVVALDDGKIGFYTSSTSGKAKRLKNNPNVVVQPSDARGRAKPGTSPLNGTAVVVTGPERDAIYDKVVAKYGFMTKVTRFLAKVGGFVKRKEQPYADRGVVITLAE